MKIEINGKLPKGFKLVDGKVVRTMSTGGTVNKTLSPIPRDQANLEAEKGETALTDLTNDGSFELYNIGGKRHTDGGTPLNLPEQSFVYSDTRSMKLTVEELASLGIKSKKKMTPAEASKRFPLNEYIEILEDETSDKVSIDTAEEMINKNKIKLSQLAFLQESKKDFSDGLPLAAYPFLISKGINPQEMEAKIQEKNGPQQTESPMSQAQMAMGPQQGNLQQFTGPPQGGIPPMGKYGYELPKALFGFHKRSKKAMEDPMSVARLAAGDMTAAANLMNYGGSISPMTGQPMVPQMGVPEGYVRDQNPLGLPGMKTGGALPKFQKKGENPLTLYNRTKKALNWANPFTFKPSDNWLISKGGVSNDLLNTKLRLGDKPIGLINTELDYYGENPIMENINIGKDFRGYGLGTLMYNKGLSVGAQPTFGGNESLISGDQSINAMESPEQTVGIWKYFDKQILQLKPWTLDKQQMWTDAGDYDFTQHLKEVDGKMVYDGPEVRLIGLNEAGKRKVASSQDFLRELMIESQGTGPGGSSPILNWETTHVEGLGPDWHSPIGRWGANKFKTFFGMEPRIGNGAPGDQEFQDYNKASLYLLLALGTFHFGNRDKIDKEKEKELYDSWVIKKSKELGIPAEQFQQYLDNPEDFEVKEITDPSTPHYIDDSTEMGIDVKKLGGQPFKMSTLRKFTNGGDPNMPNFPPAGAPMNGAMGAAPGTVSGGVIPEINVFGDMPSPTEIGPGEQMLMDMAEKRRLLLQQYSGIKTHVSANPNVLEDPEQGGVIQEQIVSLEQQIQAIDEKTSAIEKQLLQERLQLDPFAATGTPPPQARYGGIVPPCKDCLTKKKHGGSLPKYQKKGQTYGDWLKEKGYPLPEDGTIDYIYDPTANDGQGGFVGKKTVKGERKVSQSTFTPTDGGNPISLDPYRRDMVKVNGKQVGEFLFDETTGQVIMEQGPNGYEVPKRNPDYDPDYIAKLNKGADDHQDFLNVMQGDSFAGVRDLWIEQAIKEIENSKGPTSKMDPDGSRRKIHAQLKKKIADAKNDPKLMEQLERDLFRDFNNMNRILQMANASDKKFSNSQRMIEQYAAEMGIPVPSQEAIMSFQGMYGGLARAKEHGSVADKKLLEQVNTTFGADTKGANPVGKGYVSNVDGFIGATSGVQFVGVHDEVEDIVVPEIVTVDCTEEMIRIEREKCVEQKKKFDRSLGKCGGCVDIPPPIIPPETPRYETFDQDDLAVSVKSGQFPNLIMPTRQATPDPAMVDPMYVDPRQQLSTLEATAAAALRSGANASSVMASLQDQSEKVINQHEALNTKIYNNAMNINVPALQQFTQAKMENEKQYMDEVAMAMGNYDTEYKDAEDALLSAEQTQMSNADEMYIRNLENPNYWFSPKRHNIEFYNRKNIDGSITPGPISYDEAYTDCAKKFKDEREIRACIEMKTGAKRTNDGLNVNRNSENNPENVSLGTEIKGFSKRQADLVKSRNKLRKWLTGH